jgi:hypothetical protein
MTRWLISLAIAGMLASVPAITALAHEGHPHKTMGTVEGLHENHLSVKDKDGKITTHELDAKTKIRRGKAVAALADIRVGERVVVTHIERKDKAGKVTKTVTQVDLAVVTAAARKQ